MRNKRGITLIALIITIIVLLILAGVSINAVVGDNGIITQSQIASLETRYAGYKEELEMNLVSVMAEQGLKETNKVTVLNDGVKTYIPSLKDEDVGKFGVINGKLYYINSDEMGINVAKSQGIEVIPEGKSLEEFTSQVEDLAIDSIVKNMGGNAFKYTDSDGNEHQGGIQLKDKEFGIATWKLITEVVNGELKATYAGGWYYVPQGTEITGVGTATKDYIVNYTTRKSSKI